MRPMISAITKVVQAHWVILPAVLLFFLLLLRNPFSLRTQIQNLEPYPDSFHYLSPAMSLVKGDGLFLVRESRALLPSVPPLYSIFLAPFFSLNYDVRMFYFANVILSFTALFLFYVVLRKLCANKILQLCVLLIYVANYVLYWYPQLAMAENLILPLFLGAIYVTILPVSRSRAVLITLLSASFYATKFASLPLSLVFPFLYLIRIFRSRSDRRGVISFFLVSLFSAGAAYVAYEYFVRGNNLITNLFSLFFSVFSPKEITTAVSSSPSASSSSFFSLQYASDNLRTYLGWLFGGNIQLLWKSLPILPFYLAIASLAGIIASLFSKRRWSAFVILASMSANIIFMMTFYVADGRYFIIAIPSLILGISLLFSFITEKFKGRSKELGKMGVLVLCLAYLATSLPRLKFDVMLNLKYTETPWYFVAVKELDQYFGGQKFDKTPVIISALPPFLIDYYTKGIYILLPLHAQQEFRSQKQIVFGDFDYENLHQVYRDFLTAGHAVFLAKYGLGNEVYLQKEFESVLSEFPNTQVFSGCHDLCNLYQLHIESSK